MSDSTTTPPASHPPAASDTLLNSINRRRAAIQHAADALWPASEEANRPIRKTFDIPLNRAMGL